MTPSPSTKYYRAKAFIFDLDGTLIDTIPLVERFWHQFALDHGLDGDKVSFSLLSFFASNKFK